MDEAVQTTHKQPPLVGHERAAAAVAGRGKTGKEVYFERKTDDSNDNLMQAINDSDDDQYDIYFGDDDDDDDDDEHYDDCDADELGDGGGRRSARGKKAERHRLAVLAAANSGRRRSVSLNDIMAGSFVHEAASGEQIIVSRGWPLPRADRARHRRARSSTAGGGSRHPQVRLRSRLNETQKRKLLVQFLGKQQQKSPTTVGSSSASILVQSKASDVEAAMRLRGGSVQQRARRASILKLNVRRVGGGRKDNQAPGVERKSAAAGADDDKRLASQHREQTAKKGASVKAGSKHLAVQYDLPSAGNEGTGPIALGQQ